MNTEWIDYDGNMGSWFSSFLKCGSVSCTSPQQKQADIDLRARNDALDGQISTAVIAKLTAECKMPNPIGAALTSTKKIMTANNSYTAVTADPSAVNAVIALVYSDLVANNQVTAIPNCTVPAPVVNLPTQNTTSQSPINVGGFNVSSDILVLSGVILAVALLGR